MSTSELRPSGGPVTLDQLIALNDEMAALVRAGVPLERGLIEAGRDLRLALGRDGARYEHDLNLLAQRDEVEPVV